MNHHDRPTTRLFLCQTPDRLDNLDSALLGESERARLEPYRGRRYREFLQSRLLLRQALSDVVPGRLSPGDWRITERSGQPPLIEEALELGWRYSLSHSRNWIAIALSNRAPCGVDLEYHRDRRNLLELAEHWFHPEEAKALADQTDTRQLATFYRLWTLKEALIKSRQQSVFSGLLDRCRFIDCSDTLPCDGPVARHFRLPAFPFSLALVTGEDTPVQVDFGYPPGSAQTARPRMTRYRIVED